MYDSRCHELAEYFLEATHASEADKESLAQSIQSAVEDWFSAYELREKQSPSQEDDQNEKGTD
jgi:hypothetical protein